MFKQTAITGNKAILEPIVASKVEKLVNLINESGKRKADRAEEVE